METPNGSEIAENGVWSSIAYSLGELTHRATVTEFETAAWMICARRSSMPRNLVAGFGGLFGGFG